jgi:hypothetical protein
MVLRYKLKSPRVSVPESQDVEPDEGRLDAGSFTKEEFKKLLRTTVDEAVARAAGSGIAGPSRWAGTAGARSDLDPEQHLRQEQHRQEKDRYDAECYIEMQHMLKEVWKCLN